MRKILVFLLAGIMALSSFGLTSFADEDLDEINALDTSDVDDYDVEVILDEMSDEVDAEEAYEERILKDYYHNRFTDEVRKLIAERQETRRLTNSINEKRVTVAALKEKCRIKGEYWKLERASLIEKEIKVLKKSVDHLRDRKANLWDTFKEQFRQGDFGKAETTLQKIVAAKILINANLKGINALLIKEIITLN